jgi:SAM-dependent methyltransferase
MLRVYGELAKWWPLFSPLEEYAAEAAFFEDVLTKAQLPTSPTFLELGCGGGSIAFYLKKMFTQVTLTDLSAQMLDVSRALNPECEHLEGDMRTMRLERKFDVVFVHDAIDYMTSLEELREAMETAFVHCKAGGVALFVPDVVKEGFKPSTEHGGKDGDGSALRYMEWTYDPDERDTTYTVEYAFLLREGDEPTYKEYEQHICGLFAGEDWIRTLGAVGFETSIVRDQYERDVFVGRKRKV